MGEKDKPVFTDKDITEAKARHSGIALTNGKIIDLVMNEDLDKIDTIIQWVGSDIPLDQQPISRFADILTTDFAGLEDNQKEKFLINSLRFATGDFKRQQNFILLGQSTNDVTILPRMQKNLGEILNCVLMFTNNDLQSAKSLLEKAPLTNNNQVRGIGASMLSKSFYCPQPDSHGNKRDKIIKKNREDFLTKNSKIRLLAFWLDVHVQGRNPESQLFDSLLEDVYPKSDIELKTQIMIFVKESLLAGKIRDKKYYLIDRFVEKELAEAAKTETSDPSLLKEINEIKRILEINRSLKQPRDESRKAK